MDTFAFIIHPIYLKRDVSRKFPLPGKAITVKQTSGWSIALALEGRFEHYILGKKISRARAQEIDKIAYKHGFRVDGFRFFETTITSNQTEQVRLRARAAHKLS